MHDQSSTPDDLPAQIVPDKERADREYLLARDRLAAEQRKSAIEERQKDRELDLKEREIGRSLWKNPTFVAAVAVAATSLGGNIYLARENFLIEDKKAQTTNALEQRKAEMSGAFDIMKQLDLEKGVERLSFLIDIGIYHDQGQIKNYMAARLTKPPEAGEQPPPQPPRPSSNTSDASLMVRETFQARSNGAATFNKCIVPRDGWHFIQWRIEKTVVGDGDAWFVSQDKGRLCVRADASVTRDGRHSSVDAVLFAMQVPNA